MSTRKPATSAAKTDTNTPADENAARPQNDSPIAATPADSSEESENLEAASTNTTNRATTPSSTTTTTVDSEEISEVGGATGGELASPETITVPEAGAPVTPKTSAPTPTPTPTSTPTTTHTEGKSVRVTRHSSPLLLLSSPTTTATTTTTSGSSSARRDASDGDGEEPSSSNTNNNNNSTSQSLRKSSVERSMAPVIRGRKSIKDLKEAKEATKTVDVADESAVAVEVGESSASAELDEKNDQPKDTQKDKDKEKDKEKEKEKEKEPVTTPTTTCNRVTRKSLAQEQVNNTRVTRNRRKSSTIGIGGGAASAEHHQQQQQQLPPARGRGRKKTAAAPASAAIPLEAAVKRKRSEDDVEVAAKYAKIEIKPPPLDDDPADEDGNEEASSSKSSSVAIKQEPQDSDTSSPAATPTPTPTTASCRRGRGRPITKQQTPTASLSATTATTTTTRATRLNKAGSPGVVVAAEPAAPPKRRRVGSTTRKTASTSSLTTTGSHGAGDEDSKDSMASSMDDLLLAAADIKQEKLLPDFDEASLLAVTLKAAADEVESPQVPPTSTSIAAGSSSNGHACHEPLTVDTESSDSKAVAAKIEETAGVCVASEQSEAAESAGSCSGSTSVTETAGKAPSLSPEMISEGVSAISVKQFYKKPEFLANNLGIEKDPELGEIVQIVSNNEGSEGEGETEPIQTDIEIAVATEGTTGPKETKDQAKIAAKEELDNSEEQKIDDIDSNTSMKAGELQLQESGDVVEPSQESVPAINGDGDVEGDSKLPSSPLEAEAAAVAYDDIDDEIMQELANEGVVDASGNAMSTSEELQADEQDEEAEDVAPIEDQMESIKAADEEDGLDMDGLAEVVNECDTVKEGDEVDAEEEHVSDGDLAMDVDTFPTEAEGEAEAESEDIEPEIETGSATDQENMQLAGQHDDNEFPEENKENVSTSTGSHDTLDIQLTMKDDEDEEKPLAVVAAEQKPKRGADLDMKTHLSLKSDVVADAVKEDHEEEDEKPLAAVAAEQKPNSKLNGKELEVNKVDDEQRKEKELHLQNLGLLTHQAAELIRQEYIQEANSRQAQQQNQQQQHSGKRHGSKGTGGGSATHVESSGTLKTVIKLNRSSNGGAGGHSGVPTGTVIHGSGAAAAAASSSSASSIGSAAATRKASAGTGTGVSSGSAHGVRRQSLKMTFQKGRARGHGAADRSHDQHGAHAEDSYYTIQNENEDSSHSEGQAEHGFYQMVVKKDEKEKILIPEKASSFKFHPGRLCEDQCYYCSGKFGLYDTPCHVGQIKSVERQQKILANEEKLTVDNCLCDACFRHVDRRANAPSYKKRLSAPGHLETGSGGGGGGGVPGSGVPADKHYSGDGVDNEFGQVPPGTGGSSQQQHRACAIKDCGDSAGHSLRRKCIRKSVKKFLLNFEIPAGTSNVWLCDAHYNTVIQSSGCVLCKRRLGKNHMYHITSQDTDRLEKALSEMGIPVQLGVGTAVCKLCRYFANLLMKPPDSTKSIKAEFVKNYRLRLLKVHNLQDGSNEASEADDEELLNAAVTPASGVSQATTLAASDDQEMAMVVDYDGPTDSNSSSSSTTTTGNNTSSAIKQMSKLQAILQQSLVDGDASTRIGSGASSVAAAAAAASASNANSKSGSDISNVLRGNPNISMRELFHGEEELGVQFKVPFGCSSSQRTPEGWTRVQTFLQYDEPTRRLWEELQKPYGNQSSFLRHLILLEKYYRNGDLVLAPHASSNASVYTETVRQRLNSFDHGHCGGLSTSIGGGKRSSTTAAAPAASATTGAGGAAVSVTALAPTEKVNPNVAEPVIPLVELNDDDDGDQPPHHHTAGPIDVDAPSSSLERLSNASVDKLTKQLSSNAVTIIARPKDKQHQQQHHHHQQSNASAATTSPPPPSITNVQSSKDAPPLVPTGSGANSRSILKTNLLGINKAVEIVPLPSSVTATTTTTSSSSSSSSSVAPPAPILMQSSNNNNNSSKPPPAANLEKPHKILDVANKLLNSQNEAQQHSASLLTMPPKLKPALSTSSLPLAVGGGGGVSGIKPQLLSSPPELISLQRRRAGAAIAAGAGGSSGQTIAGAAAMAAAASSLLGNMSSKRLQLPRAGGGSGGGGNTRPSGPPPNVVILPETLTPQERHESKSWKPTLIPLEDQHKVPNKSHALYQTADGRRLPALVQVQSGGKPYLISIFDYNRMCILRREKLLRDQMLKANAKPKVGQTQQQQSNVAGSAAELLNFAKMTQQQHQTARQQIQQMQQKLQQKQQQQQQQHHHQQQQQQQQMPTLQPGGGGGGSANSNLRLARLAPKPMPPLTNPTQNVNAAAAAAAAVAGFPPLLANALVNSNNNNSLDSNSSWLWKNFPDANQYLLNGNGGGGGGGGPTGPAVGGGSKMPHLTAKSSTATTGSSSSSNNLKMGSSSSYTLKQQQHQQKLIENAIMSKIPKSLTVIPQQIGNEAASSGAGAAANKD